jgi:hypothetical protein
LLADAYNGMAHLAAFIHLSSLPSFTKLIMKKHPAA